MIVEEKRDQALYAIHQIFIHLKLLAYREESFRVVANILDSAERLPAIMASPDDETSVFRDYLESMARRFPGIEPILESFDQNEIDPWW
jgi:hypothetical protein